MKAGSTVRGPLGFARAAVLRLRSKGSLATSPLRRMLATLRESASTHLSTRAVGLFLVRAFLILGALSVLTAIGHAATRATPAGTVTADTASPAAVAAPDTLQGPAASAVNQVQSASLLEPGVLTMPAITIEVPAPHAGRATPEDPVYINQATLEDLERLPSVGPKRAANILILRQRLGRFQRVEDLLRVKGIGRSTLQKLRPLIRLDSAQSAQSDAGAH